METHYTPDIEEFHIGFEYEKNDGEAWCKTIVKGYKQIRNAEILIEQNSTRVKYLDKEDIESLRWIDGEAKGLGGYIIDVTNEEIHHGFYQMYIHDNRDKGFWFVQIHDFINTDYLFQGTIKNKSELARVMKQLGI